MSSKFSQVTQQAQEFLSRLSVDELPSLAPGSNVQVDAVAQPDSSSTNLQADGLEVDTSRVSLDQQHNPTAPPHSQHNRSTFRAYERRSPKTGALRGSSHSDVPPQQSIAAALSVAAEKAATAALDDDPNQAVFFQPPGHPMQVMIDGEIWPPIFKPEFLRSAKKYQPQDSDVFVVTYPKCGTTWIQHICSQIMVKNYEPAEGKELFLTSPMIERMGAKYLENLVHPRLLKTHFNYANCPKNPNAKYIYVVRNPKDALVSYYFHNQLFNVYDFENGDFATFVDLFLAGRLGFGDYFDHLLSWLPHIHDENVLFLKYEDMFADLETAVLRIGEFLGGAARDVVRDLTSLARVVHASEIDSMKKNQDRFFSQSSLRQKDGFIRKGGSRNWKEHMTREQSDRMDALVAERLRGTDAEAWWRYELCWDDNEALRLMCEEANLCTLRPDASLVDKAQRKDSAEDEKNAPSDTWKIMSRDNGAPNGEVHAAQHCRQNAFTGLFVSVAAFGNRLAAVETRRASTTDAPLSASVPTSTQMARRASSGIGSLVHAGGTAMLTTSLGDAQSSATSGYASMRASNLSLQKAVHTSAHKAQ